MPEKKKRNHRSPVEKAAILRRHLVDKVPVSDLCDEYGIQPSVFYSWQRQAFENLEGLFADARGGKRAHGDRDRELELKDAKIASLEAKVARKDEIIADISEVHLELKKSLGES